MTWLYIGFDAKAGGYVYLKDEKYVYVKPRGTNITRYLGKLLDLAHRLAELFTEATVKKLQTHLEKIRAEEEKRQTRATVSREAVEEITESLEFIADVARAFAYYWENMLVPVVDRLVGIAPRTAKELFVRKLLEGVTWLAKRVSKMWNTICVDESNPARTDPKCFLIEIADEAEKMLKKIRKLLGQG